MLKRKKVLVTGASGFIGANLARKFLNEGAAVAIMTRATSNKWRLKDILPEVREFQADLRESAELKKIMQELKPEIIVHSAVYGGFTFQTEPRQIMASNLLGTVNLLDAAKDHGFDLFINTGSSSEYGLKSKPMVETDRLEPIGPYGVSKSAAALFCRAAALQYNLPVITLRLFSPYGYFDDSSRLVASVIADCLHGRNPALASPEPVRDFVFVEDVVEAYLKAIEQGARFKGEAVNIGSGRQSSVNDVVTNIINLTGSSLKPDWGKRSSGRTEPKTWQADIQLAKQLLNWEPRHSLQQGLAKSVAWMRDNLLSYN